TYFFAREAAHTENVMKTLYGLQQFISLFLSRFCSNVETRGLHERFLWVMYAFTVIFTSLLEKTLGLKRLNSRIRLTLITIGTSASPRSAMRQTQLPASWTPNSGSFGS